MSKMASDRIEWIDELKGFLLILVCLQHACVEILFWGGDLLAMCKPFRMVAFFFLSGMLFSNRRYSTISEYTKAKSKTLLMPYLLLSLLFAFLDPRLYDITLMQSPISAFQPFEVSAIHSSVDYFCQELKYCFWKGYSVPVSGALWFVWALFLVSVCFFIAHYLSGGNKFMIAVYAVVCGGLGWLCNLWHYDLPFRLSSVFTASFFFSLGYICRHYIPVIMNFSRMVLGVVCMSLALMYLYFINTFDGGIGLSSNLLGNSLVGFLLKTLCGVSLIICIFVLWSKINVAKTLKGILRNIARNALIVLAIHLWVIHCCRIFLSQYVEMGYFPWLVTLMMVVVTWLAIPLFRNKLYWIIGKEKISVKSSLAIS